MSDIATRCDVSAESVRLWAAGRRRAGLRSFPGPRQVVGTATSGKTMALFAWRDVVSWVREVLGIDPDEGITYLDDRQVADLNSELANLAEVRADTDWHPMMTASRLSMTHSHPGSAEVRPLPERARLTTLVADVRELPADPDAHGHLDVLLSLAMSRADE
jgi:hypothetical protein